MTKFNDNYSKVMRSIIVITFYFIWPSITKFIMNLLGFEVSSLGSFISNIILLIIVVVIYLKDIISSLNKLSLKKIICLFLSLIVVQVLTNLLSVLILGVKNHSSYGGLLPAYLDSWPVLMGISLVVIYPILETLIFSKTFKDIINGEWAFIFCSSLFFWLVNLLAFDFRYASIIATMSCFTASIVINYFYYKDNNIGSIIIVKMIYNLVFLLLP